MLITTYLELSTHTHTHILSPISIITIIKYMQNSRFIREYQADPRAFYHHGYPTQRLLHALQKRFQKLHKRCVEARGQRASALASRVHVVGRAEVRQVRAVGSHAEKTFTVTLQISHRLVDVHTHFHAFDQSDTPAIKPTIEWESEGRERRFV